ncbi:MAG: hypothetical protein ACI89E_001845 [Planctomycetota bacterium]
MRQVELVHDRDGALDGVRSSLVEFLVCQGSQRLLGQLGSVRGAVEAACDEVRASVLFEQAAPRQLNAGGPGHGAVGILDASVAPVELTVPGPQKRMPAESQSPEPART